MWYYPMEIRQIQGPGRSPLSQRAVWHRAVGLRMLGVVSFLLIVVLLWMTPVAFGQSRVANSNKGIKTQKNATHLRAPVNASSSPLLESRPRYHVEPGDVLALEFPYTPNMDQTLTIQPDGYITLRGVGDFYAEGKTTDQLSKGLKSDYEKILNDPVINVNLKNFQRPYFIVGGQVGHPGKFNLRENTTVIEALAIAGGLTSSSKHSQVLLFRRVRPGTVQVIKVNVKKMIHSRNLSEDVYLQPGDMLFVPKNFISKIAPFLPTTALSTYFTGPVKW